MAKSVLGSGQQVKGIKELAAKIKAIGDATMSREALRILGDASNQFRVKAIQNAKSANWPHEVIDNAFVDARPALGFTGKRVKKISALFGFAKRGRSKPYRPGYVEWNAKDTGRLIGMSLATLFEFGGSKVAARPAFRPALASARPGALNIIENGLRNLIEAAARKVS